MHRLAKPPYLRGFSSLARRAVHRIAFPVVSGVVDYDMWAIPRRSSSTPRIFAALLTWVSPSLISLSTPGSPGRRSTSPHPTRCPGIPVCRTGGAPDVLRATSPRDATSRAGIHHSWPMSPHPLDCPSGNLRSSFLRQQSTELCHFGVDPLNAVVAGYADAVVAVQDEVKAPYLVEA